MSDSYGYPAPNSGPLDAPAWSPESQPSATCLWDFLLTRLRCDGDRLALRAKLNGQWQAWTWERLARQIRAAGEQLIRAGISTGDRVATWSENRWEWIVWDLAIQGVGAVHVPLHAALPATQVEQLLLHAEARGLIASPRLLDRLRGKLLNRIPTWEQTLAVSERVEMTPTQSDSLSAVSGQEQETDALRRGEALHDQLERWKLRQTDPHAMTTLLYTSGTTGQAKGVMLSQQNLVANVLGKLRAIPLFPEDARYALLPMTHIFARTCDLATWLAVGCQLVVGSHKEAWFDEIREVEPTYLNAVPLFYQWCWQRAALQNRLEDRSVLREILGSRIRVCNCGGAALADSVHDWFRAQGVCLITGYGLTESSPVITSSSPDQMKRSAVGKALFNVELRLDADGQVLARGPNIMLGYYREPELTREALDEGWLATGDLGQLDDQGYLTLVGRKKELIVTPGGLKIVPTEIERRLTELSWVNQAWITADSDGHPSAVLIADLDRLTQLAPLTANRLAEKSNLAIDVHRLAAELENAAQKPLESGKEADERYALTRSLLEATADLPKYCRVWRVVLDPNPFTIEEGTVTAKGSLRRQEIETRRSDLIRQLLRIDESVE